MVPTKKPVELAFPNRKTLLEAATGKDLGLDGFSDNGVWSGATRKQIAETFAETMDILCSNVGA